MIINSQFSGTRQELAAHLKSRGLTLMGAGEPEPGNWVYVAMGSGSPKRPEATLTLHRPAQEITALLRRHGLWEVVEAFDEEGNPALLTPKERVDLCVRAERGEDETGI